MRFLLLALIAVFVHLVPASIPLPGPIEESPIEFHNDFVIYMRRVFTPQQDFCICIIISGETVPPIFYYIYVNDVLAEVREEPINSEQIFKISPKYFTHPHKNRVEIVVVNKWQILIQKIVEVHSSSHTGDLSKNGSIFIQRSKPIYNPNETVEFRTFGLNKTLQTINEPLNITLYDPKDNIMQIWNNQTNSTGVISCYFELSDQPVTGKWKIKIKQSNSGLEKIAGFDVNEHVLPPISVSLTGDKYIYQLGLPAFFIARLNLNFVVKAKYSFGVGVKGKLIMRVSITEPYNISIQEEAHIEGTYHYKFSLDKFLSFKRRVIIYEYPFWTYISFKVVAIVIDKETGLETKAPPFFVYIRPSPIEVKVPPIYSFKPKLCNKVPVHIKRTDGLPLTSHDVKEKLNVTFVSENKSHSELVRIPMDGDVSINLPKGNYTIIKIRYNGSYQDQPYMIVKTIWLKKYWSPTKSYVKASLNQGCCKAGDNIIACIESTVPLKRVYYLVMRGDQFIGHGSKYFYGLTTNIRIRSQKSWLPGVDIIFTCVTREDYFLIDVLPVKLNVEFRYKISGMFSPKQNRPGKETILRMAAAPTSTVFILAQDVRLQYSGKTKYITKNDITKHLFGSFDSGYPYYASNTRALLDYYRIRFFTKKIRDSDIAPVPPFPVSYLLSDGKLRTKLSSKGNIEESTAVLRGDSDDVWIWKAVEIPSTGHVEIEEKTPLSITSWKGNAFGIHPIYGISVLERPLEFVSFQNLFLKFDLPYSVIRGENISLTGIVYNDFLISMNVLVFVASSSLKFANNEKNLSVGPETYEGIKFWASAVKVGNAVIYFELWSNGKLYDRLKKILIVKPEGRPLYFNKEIAVELGKNSPTIENFNISIPKEGVVPGSIRIEISVIGDVLGPAIENLENYVRLPQGCGEQTALHLFPNVFVFNYLTSRNALEPGLREKLIGYTRRGYQNQMQFQRKDGSFSAFQKDKEGSLWLTAFVAKGLQLVIDSNMDVVIDAEKLNLSLHWLIKQQKRDGSFKETGRVIHQSMQGGAGDGHALTAYVLNALVSLKYLDPSKAGRAINRALKYIKLDVERLDDYTLSLLCYTFARLNIINYFHFVEEKLLKIASKESPLHWDGNYAIEKTAYVLLAYAQTVKIFPAFIENGRSILGWLVSKRTSIGGFSNTQDTIVALEAMSAFAVILDRPTEARIKITAKDYTHKFKPITAENKYIIQKKTVPNHQRNFRINALGEGTVYVRFSWQFNEENEKNDNFGLSVQVNSESLDANHIRLCICFEWTLKNDSGMITCEVQLPSGFEKDEISCKEQSCGIQKYPDDDCWQEYQYEENEIIFYLNNFDKKNSFCAEITADRKYDVENANVPLYVTCSSYYTGLSLELAYYAFENSPSKIP